MTTNLILAEVHRLILHRAGVPAAAFAIRRIDQSDRTKVVFATAAHHEAAIAWLERLRDHAISYTDAASFAVMESLGCRRCLSFDSDFRRAGFLAWQDDR